MARRFAKQAGVTQKDFRPMLEVELALFVLAEFAPGESAKDAWALVSGYDFRRAEHRLGQIPAAIRWLLEPVKPEHDWARRLAQYQVFAQQARMFDVPDSAQPSVRRQLAGGAEREDQYRELLAALPPHHVEDPLIAELGVRHRVRRTGHSVVIPAEIVVKRPPRHRPLRARKIFTFTWSDLRKTAMSMDAHDHKCWCDNKWLERIEDLELVVGRQVTAKRLQLKDLLQVVGMPAVGKTTLIVVASVLASRRKHHVTVVLGDVVSVLTARSVGGQRDAISGNGVGS
ncbi:hypothetical protein [Lentzea flava]|nr:hypothetical protein [Lentzea flava]MCP2205459.1 hypothetical protein [Lentzea flava]